MRWLSCILFALYVLQLATSAGAEEANQTYPYVAYVTAEHAPIFAGPGNAHYMTDQLSRGMQVEVYRDISGWLAIRPPVGSFSWVPAKDVELTDEPDVAAAKQDGVPVWIGTRVDREADHQWQVQLERGTLVKVLGTKRRGGGKQPLESWYRIEPPPGEFRFIRAEDIASEESRDSEPMELAEDSGPMAPGEEEAPAELPSVLVKNAKPIERRPQDPRKPARREVDNVDDEDSKVIPAQFTPRDRKDRTPTPSTPTRSTSASPFKEVGASAPRVASLDRAPAMEPSGLLTASSKFDDKLTELELQLSQLAARDPRQWQLEGLRAQAEQLVSSGQTTLERGRARLVLDKISQFEDLAARAQTVAAPTIREPGISSSSTEPTPADPATKAEGLKIPDGVTYDGVGWLKPVYSAKRVAPPYALVDVDGKVLQYVTPAPGLNLSRHVKKPVGMFGQKSHLAEFKADHLTVSKVVDLTKYQK